jgi:hypothetical protein
MTEPDLVLQSPLLPSFLPPSFLSPSLLMPQSTTRDLWCCAVTTRLRAGIVSKNQKVIHQPKSHWNRYMVAKDTFYLLTNSNSMSYEDN